MHLKNCKSAGNGARERKGWPKVSFEQKAAVSEVTYDALYYLYIYLFILLHTLSNNWPSEKWSLYLGT
jgi:hypothetical protein